MAHSKSALKRWRQNEAHRERNKPVRTAARTAVKKAHTAIGAGATDDARAAVREATAILDRAAKRRIIHPNAASRHKSRMMKQLAASTGVPAAEPAKKTRKPAAAKKPAAKRAPAKPRTAKAKSTE